MNPADRVREAASSAVVRFTALLEYLDHIAKGRDGSPHVDAEDRSALNALRAAIALHVASQAPAKPDEVGAAREAFYDACRRVNELRDECPVCEDGPPQEWYDDYEKAGCEERSAYDALLAAERAEKEGG